MIGAPCSPPPLLPSCGRAHLEQQKEGYLFKTKNSLIHKNNGRQKQFSPSLPVASSRYRDWQTRGVTLSAARGSAERAAQPLEDYFLRHVTFVYPQLSLLVETFRFVGEGQESRLGSARKRLHVLHMSISCCKANGKRIQRLSSR